MEKVNNMKKTVLTCAAVAFFATGCVTQTGTGSLLGAGLGALVGQAIGKDTKGTLIGAGIGAAVGGAIGANEDAKKKNGDK